MKSLLAELNMRYFNSANGYSDSNFIEINLIFDSASSPIILDDTIPVSLFDEEFGLVFRSVEQPKTIRNIQT